MYQPVALFIGLRYMRGRASDRFARFVSWLSSIGITLGVMAMIVVMSVMNGFEQDLQRNTLSLMPQALITTASGSLDPRQYPLSELSQLQGVNRITALTSAEVVLQSAHNVAVAVMLGVNEQDQDPLVKFIANDYFSQLKAGEYKVILGDQLANKLGVRIGQQVRLMATSASQLTPMGRIPSQRLFNVVGIFSSGTESDSTQLLVNQQDASRLMRYPPGSVSGWRLYLNQPLDVAKLSQQPLAKGLVWQDWRIRKGEVFQAVKMEKNMMGFLISLIVIVAAFNLITSLGLMVMEKQGEVAILQTQGLTRWQIMAVFIIQGATAGIVGSFVGAGLGLLLADNLNRIVPSMSGILLPVYIEPLQVATIVFFAIVLALVSTLYPSWRAAAVQPAEALRYE